MIIKVNEDNLLEVGKKLRGASFFELMGDVSRAQAMGKTLLLQVNEYSSKPNLLFYMGEQFVDNYLLLDDRIAEYVMTEEAWEGGS